MTYKKINSNITIFHHFELSKSQFVLYDDEFEYPIIQGSKGLVNTVIKTLPKNSIIIYYKKSLDNLSFKKIAIYNGRTQSKSGQITKSTPLT